MHIVSQRLGPANVDPQRTLVKQIPVGYTFHVALYTQGR
jgi:hypothetical protein